LIVTIGTEAFSLLKPIYQLRQQKWPTSKRCVRIPLFVIFVIYSEILPRVLVAPFASALILRTKKK